MIGQSVVVLLSLLSCRRHCPMRINSAVQLKSYCEMTLIAIIEEKAKILFRPPVHNSPPPISDSKSHVRGEGIVQEEPPTTQQQQPWLKIMSSFRTPFCIWPFVCCLRPKNKWRCYGDWVSHTST